MVVGLVVVVDCRGLLLSCCVGRVGWFRYCLVGVFCRLLGCWLLLGIVLGVGFCCCWL